MACKVCKDSYGTSYLIPHAPHAKPPLGKRLLGSPAVHVWWDRDHAHKADENLLLRQENDTKRADVISLTLGQAYDMLHALRLAIMRS